MMQWLFYFIGLIGLYLVLQIVISSRRNRYEKEMETVVFRVAVSRLNERGPIVAEQIYAALHGLEENYSLGDYFAGRTLPRISLEIASVNNRIQFFIWA